ncbi:MAG: hypothetical protein LBE82_06115 [Chitinophagaceae bacterium]|jgi:hypothetical protein|nr:hypothetical protein [Chitinophagaceae bacterium]
MQKILFAFFTGLLLFSHSIDARAQKNIQVEIGYSSVDANIKQPEQMRNEPFVNYDYTISSLMLLYAGVKREFVISKDKRWSFLAGVRFSLTQSAINANNDYFYWLYSQEGVNTDFARIKKINQFTYFVGIPLELRVMPQYFQLLGQPMYVKMGASFDFRMAAHTGLQFEDNNMKQVENEIVNQVEKPSTLLYHLQPGVGVKLGKLEKYFGSIELIIPITIAKSSGIMNTPAVGGGIQFNLFIPTHKK